MDRVKMPSLLLAKLPQEGGRSPLRVIFIQKSFRILEELKGNNGCYKNKGGGGCYGDLGWGSSGVVEEGAAEVGESYRREAGNPWGIWG